jgi:hypothetical protein
MPQPIRTQVVLTICKIDPVVRNAEAMLRASRKLLGDRLTFSLVRSTFFKQFWWAALGCCCACASDLSTQLQQGGGGVGCGEGARAGTPRGRRRARPSPCTRLCICLTGAAA